MLRRTTANIARAAVCIAALSLASCAGDRRDGQVPPTRIDDVQAESNPVHEDELTPAPRSPAGFSHFGGAEPRLRTWADFHFYPNADLELYEIDGSWVGAKVIPGAHTAILLDEGSVIENTTAHPQYYSICILLPGDVQPGQVIPLRPAASQRRIFRQEHRGDRAVDLSFAEVGEVTVRGMKGYSIPVVRPHTARSIGTATVLAKTPTTMTIEVDAKIPLRLAFDGPEDHYNLKVQRTYLLSLKAAAPDAPDAAPPAIDPPARRSDNMPPP